MYHYLFITVLLGIGVISGCATTQQSAESSPDAADGPETTAEIASGYELDRYLPNPIDEEISNSYYAAVANGTRTFSGMPGKSYWQQKSTYDMDVELHPDRKMISGKGTITYYNNSPDTLNRLFLELAQNVHQEGVLRNESAEVTGGMELGDIVLEGDSLSVIQQRGQPGYIVDGTIMAILTPQQIVPGDSVKLNISWNFNIPQEGAGGRMGYSKDNLFFIAYWYPKMRVYDDVNGWFTDPFLINAEFYHDFADYHVTVKVPEQWLVAATGTLENGKEVLRPPIYDRLTKAHNSDKVMNVVDEKDFGKVTKSSPDSIITWQFTAENVRDFAFSVTKESIWDATRSPVGDLDNDGQTDYAHINALYRSSASLWKDAARYTRHSVRFLSDYTGLNYPWPHMTSVEGGGIIGGGMEFPMITLIGSYSGQPAESLYAVIAHEVAHMWVPMQVSTNERRYSWIDEGTTTFNESQAKLDFYPDGPDYELRDFQSYLSIAGTDFEGEIMRWSDYHYNGFAYGIASYSKPAALLIALRGLLGKEIFEEALQTFLANWRYKHPYPWDLFNTFEDVSGRDLDWFWRSWYYEVWTLDQAVASVSAVEEGTRIIIQDFGQVPMPGQVQITLSDGTIINRTIDVETWLSGATTAVLVIKEQAEVTKVEIDPDFLFPDIDRSNNLWEKQ